MSINVEIDISDVDGLSESLSEMETKISDLAQLKLAILSAVSTLNDDSTQALMEALKLIFVSDGNTCGLDTIFHIEGEKKTYATNGRIAVKLCNVDPNAWLPTNIVNKPNASTKAVLSLETIFSKDRKESKSAKLSIRLLRQILQLADLIPNSELLEIEIESKQDPVYLKVHDKKKKNSGEFVLMPVVDPGE